MDGELRDILAAKGLSACDQIVSGQHAPIKTGNALPLRNIPLGSTVHNVELKPGKGGQIARSAGASVQVLAKDGGYVTLRLKSGEMRKVHAECRATLGEVSNSEHSLRSEEHTSELQSLMRISYAVFCLKKKKNTQYQYVHYTH